MNPEELKARTKRFAVRVLKLADALPRKPSGRTLASQVANSGTSVASNYRAACKARSRKEFVSKLGIAEEEADETQLWLELIVEADLFPVKRISALHQETCELTAILAASRKSAARSL